MNECQQAMRLSAYHDGELSAEDGRQVERHIQHCPSCAAELERLRVVTRAAGAFAPVEMPQAVLRRLHKRVDSLPSRGINHLAEAMAAMAATVLIACSIGLLTRTAPAQGPQAAESLDQIVSTQPADGASAAPEEQLASWMVQDLSGRNQRD